MTTTLFEIAAQYRHITDVLMDSGADEQTLADTLEGEAWDLECKASNYGFVIRNLQASAAAIKEAEAQMAARRKSMENRASYLVERLKTGMEIAGVTQLSCPYFAVKVQKNPPAVDVWDEKQVPEKYWIQPETPAKVISKELIKADIKNGVDVPGAKQVQGTKLVIK